MPRTHSIGPIKSVVLISIAFAFDALKALLLSLNALVGIGTVIDVVCSVILSFIENGIEYMLLQFSGAYKKGNLSSAALMAGTCIVGFVPFIDDLPITTITVLATILQSRKADKKRWASEDAAAKKQQQEYQRESAQRAQAAAEAAARANQQRESAMRISREAA